ncbi:MAG: hypothetical protein JKY33_04220 [Bacteroidia bacterium]|nr:hypothetical protein [Bacteroidia bacterium]
MSKSKINTALHLQNTYLLGKLGEAQSTQLKGTATLLNASKLILEQSLQNNYEIQNLQRQMNAANEVMRKVLDNQIKEIKHKERQRYFKEFVWWANRMVEKTQSFSNSIVIYKISNNYLSALKEACNIAVSELEEITDKEYASNCIKIIDTLINSSISTQADYEKSKFFTFDTHVSEMQNLEINKMSSDTKIQILRNTLKNRPTRTMSDLNKDPFGFIHNYLVEKFKIHKHKIYNQLERLYMGIYELFGEKKQNTEELIQYYDTKQAELNNLEKEIKTLNNEIEEKNNSVKTIINNLYSQYPEFDEFMLEYEKTETEFKRKWSGITN